jgi:SAM-dependent methyltransferase
VSHYDPDAFDAYEVRGWATKEAARYDELAGRVTSQVADVLLDAVGVEAGMRVLDVATGPGYVAGRAHARGARATGLDFSETMLTLARERHPHAQFTRGDATALPFAAGSFDAVVGAFVLLHLGRPERAAAEAFRVLARGGRAAFSVWGLPSEGRWLGVLLDALADTGAGPPAEIPPGPAIFRFADDAEFTGLLVGAGFADVAVKTAEMSLHIADADELWNGLIDGTVRVGPLVRAQSEDLQSRIRERFDELLDEHRVHDGFDLPVVVKLAHGEKVD